MAPLTQYLTQPSPPPDSLEGMTLEVNCDVMSTMSTLEDPSVFSSSVESGSKHNKTSSSNSKSKHRPSSFTIPENNDSTSTTEEEDDDDSDERPPPPLRRKSSRGNFPNILKFLAIQRQELGVNPDKKRVYFAPESKISQTLIIESHKDFSSRERNRCWWTPSEKDKCMARHERIVSRMEHRKPCRKGQTFRGLESWTAAGAANLDRVINECVDAVMDEQDHQWKVQRDDFERIAFVSQQVTNDSAQRARQVGLIDEQEAMQARMESWLEEDDGATVGSGMGKSVASAVRRRKKMDHLRDRRDPTLNKKRRSSKTEKDNESHSHSKPPTAPLKDSHHKNSHGMQKQASSSSLKDKKSSHGSHHSHKSDDKLRRSTHSSSGSSRHRSHTSSSKKSSSRSSSVSSSKRDKNDKEKSSSRHRSKSRDGRHSSSNSSVSSSSKTKSSASSSRKDLSKSSSRRSTKDAIPSDAKPPLHTPPTSVSSSTSDPPSLAATKSSSRSKCSDPPGRHVERNKSTHADKTKLTAAKQ